MKTKIVLAITPIFFLSASCGLFKTPIAAGVVKSVNGGADWQFSNTLKGVKNGTISSLNVYQLAFDPDNREVVYAGANNAGIYKSEDSGANWSRLLSDILVYDFAVDPGNGKTIYAAGFYTDHGRVLKTVNGGGSWQQIFNEGSANNAVRAIALNPQNPNQMVIGTASGALDKSSDGGMTWEFLQNFDDRVSQIAWQNGRLYVLLQTKGLFESADSGATFGELTQSLTANSGSNFFANGYGRIENFNQFAVDSVVSSLIYLTTTKGLFKTFDEGKSWMNVALPIQPAGSVARAIAVARSSSNIVFTSVGNTIYKSIDAGVTWQTQRVATAGLINYILIDPQLPQIVYAGIYGNN